MSFDTSVNETNTMFATEEEILADRKAFVSNLGILLGQTRERIENLVCSDDGDSVTITYKGGHQEIISIRHDSYFAIIRDVARAVEL